MSTKPSRISARLASACDLELVVLLCLKSFKTSVATFCHNKRFASSICSSVNEDQYYSLDIFRGTWIVIEIYIASTTVQKWLSSYQNNQLYMYCRFYFSACTTTISRSFLTFRHICQAHCLLRFLLHLCLSVENSELYLSRPCFDSCQLQCNVVTRWAKFGS